MGTDRERKLAVRIITWCRICRLYTKMYNFDFFKILEFRYFMGVISAVYKMAYVKIIKNLMHFVHLFYVLSVAILFKKCYNYD